MTRAGQEWEGATAQERVRSRFRFIVATIGQVDPSVDPALVEDIVAAVAHNRVLVWRVAFQLRSHPEDLTSGRSGVSGMVSDIIGRVILAGGQGLVRPRCAQCSRDNATLKWSNDAGEKICQPCSVRNHHEPCGRCSQLRRVAKRQPDGTGSCQPCHTQSAAEVCAGCGQHRKVHGHLDDGRPLCARCVRADAHIATCPGCGHLQVTIRTSAGHRCRPCRAARETGGGWEGTGDQRQAARTATIVGAVRIAAPNTQASLILAAVGQVAAAPIKRARLAEYLTVHPEALTSGDSGSPKAVGHLIHALTAAGVAGLVAPRCSVCGAERELFHTLGEGQRICVPCYTRTHAEKCGGCGRLRPVVHRSLDRTARCSRCVDRGAAEACGRCGRVKQVARRAPEATALCSTCVRRDPGTWEPCSGCGRTRPVNARTDDRAPLCPTCYTSPVDTCDLCGRAAPISSRLGGTVVCRYCYRGHTDRCGRCATHTVCRTLPDLGIICLSCLLTQRVDDLLTGEDGTINAIWDPLRTALAIGWLYRSPAVAVLQEMGTGASPVSHTTLDRAAGQARYASGVEHLRGLLVGVTILPERDNHLLRLEQRLATLVAAAHPDDRQVLTLYARWRLIPRVRRASHAGKHTGSRSGGAHTALRMVAGHLDWLRRHQVGLADSTQAHVDQWAATHPGHTSTVRTFLRWAAANRRTPRHDLAVPDNSHPHVFSTDDQRWALTRQALADHTWTVSDRVAAALILLYAQTPSRIATLTRRDLGTDNEGRLTLRLGADPITVPPPLDQLLTQLPEPQRHGLAATVILDQEWLFPGSRPGRHVDPTTVMRRLRLHGIHPRAARNTALLQLATETPTPVIADLLGLNLNTAEKWREVAGARWANYPSRRP